MAHSRRPRASTSRCRRALSTLSWTLLLPLVLLFAQQGSLGHEYGHRIAASKNSRDGSPATPERCPGCLAYAQLGGAVAVGAEAVPLLSHLAFHLVAATGGTGVDLRIAAPRSRGPPEI